VLNDLRAGKLTDEMTATLEQVCKELSKRYEN